MPTPEPVLLGQIMTRHVFPVSLDDTVAQVRDIFEKHHFHHALVVEDKKLVGVISDRDLLRTISPFVGHEFTERPQDLATLNRRAHQIMSRHLITAGVETTLAEGVDLILSHEISSLPIVDENMRPLGIVSWKDILRAMVPVPPA